MSRQGQLAYSFAKRHGVLLVKQGESQEQGLLLREDVKLSSLMEVRRVFGSLEIHQSLPTADFNQRLAQAYQGDGGESQQAVEGLEDHPDLESLAESVPETEDLMEQEDENYEDVDVDINNFEKQWLSYVSDGETSTFTENGIRKDQIMESILDWLGTPYRFGGTSRKSIDCSAFTQTIFKEAAEVKLPRTARWQYTLGEKIDNLDDLQFGDLIFFHTRSYARASHCGIYLGDNLFAHASSRHGVTVSSLKSGYYNKRFIGGRRLTDEDIIQLSTVKEQDEQPNTKFGG